LLRRCKTVNTASTNARLTWAWRSRRLRRLRTVPIDARSLRLAAAVGEWVVRRGRRRVEALRAWRLHVTRHARLALLLLRRRRETGTTLRCATSHDPLKQVRRAMSNGWRWRLRRT
jgi:hypothetical protein